MTDCVLWDGSLNAEGYGTVFRDGWNQRAHRVIYEEQVGPIPEGHVLDHLCHNEAASRGECDGGETCLHRRCVNVWHLEPVTDAENIARGRLGYASRTLCRAGLHEITDPSSWRIGPHGRQCLACYEAAQDRRTRRRSAIRAARRAVKQGGTTDAS